MNTIYTEIPSPWGALLLTSDGDALTGLYYPGERHAPRPTTEWRRSPGAGVFAAVERQLREYADGVRREFDVPVELRGTPFQRAVWKAIREIPYGKTISYAALAARIGDRRAVRAAGAATGRNPVSIIVPCHRVVGSDGALTGYAGGIERKRALLALESSCTLHSSGAAALLGVGRTIPRTVKEIS
jgi:methylated-DNA-[protein]-cysteine S-methyltransferase